MVRQKSVNGRKQTANQAQVNREITLFAKPVLLITHLSLMGETDPAIAVIGHPTHRHVRAVGPRPVANGRH